MKTRVYQVMAIIGILSLAALVGTQTWGQNAKPDTAKPAVVKPEAAKPAAAKPEAAKPEAAKPEAAKPEAAKAGPMVFIGQTLIGVADIKAPVEEVFKFGEDPMFVPKWLTIVKSVSNVQGKGLGQMYSWTGELEGVAIEGTNVVVDYVANQRIVVQSTVGTIWTGLYLPGPDGGTKLIVAEYLLLPVPADPAGQAAAIKKANEDFQGYVNNIKKVIETK